MHRLSAAFVITALIAVVLVGAGSDRASGGAVIIMDTVYVTTTADVANADEFCSLREAIHAANINVSYIGCGSLFNPVFIAFSLPPGSVIEVATPLPALTGLTFMDGDLGGGSKIHIRQAADATDATANGIVVGTTTEEGAAGSFVQNLVLTDFDSLIVGGQGILILDRNVTVTGNLIGVTPDGEAAPNFNGITIKEHYARVGGTTGVTPAGPCTGFCNTISGNRNFGIFIWELGSVIESNFIGTDAAGVAAVPNNKGIYTIATTNIGGPSLAAGNVISGNVYEGIHANFGGWVIIENNRIGTNAAGTAAVLSNGAAQQSGVYLRGTLGASIGGVGRGNVISGNMEYGVYLGSTRTTTVLGNIIGPQVDGVTPLDSNSQTGVGLINSISQYNQVGGTAPGQANIIAYNDNDGGVIIDGSTGSTLNSVRGNSIHSNNGKGIVVSAGSNNGIIPPLIFAATTNGANGAACSFCLVDLYSDSQDEGRIYEATTGAGDNGLWSYNGPLTGPNLTAVTANPFGSETSEFSLPFALPDFVTPTPSPSPSPTATATMTATATTTATGAPTVTASGTAAPSPTATAQPTSTGEPTLSQGDVNCDGEIDGADELQLLLFAADLDEGNPAPCPDLFDDPPGSDFPWGDINCDGVVNAIDALYLIAFRAGFDLERADNDCTPIGGDFT